MTCQDPGTRVVEIVCQDSRNTAKTQRVGTPSENDVQRVFLHAVMDDVFFNGLLAIKKTQNACSHARFSFNGLLAIEKIQHAVMHDLF